MVDDRALAPTVLFTAELPSLHRCNFLLSDRVVKMLSVVVLVFALLWLPYRGMLVYNSFASMFGVPMFLDLWFLMFAKTCVYINSAINPFLYNVMSTNFRQAFHRTLIRKKTRLQRGRTSLAPSTLSTQTL